MRTLQGFEVLGCVLALISLSTCGIISGEGENKVVEKRLADDVYTTVRDFTECGSGYRLIIDKTVDIDLTAKDYPAGYSCDWIIAGEEKCVPEISCSTLDIQKVDEDCSDEYLEINDGVGGLEKFCGQKPPEKPLRASKGMRDLFVKFQASEAKGTKKGLKCVVKCAEKPEAVQPLKDTFEPKIDSRCVCGLQNKDDRIVGGEDAKMNEFPWQVAVVLNGTRSPQCGGSVINDRFVLTAAHCHAFAKQQPWEVEVLIHAQLIDQTRLGGWKDADIGVKGGIHSSGWNEKQLTDADEKTQRYKVVEIINHPLFSDTYDYDVSLLRLEKSIDLAHPDAPTPICLPHPGYDQTMDNEQPFVSGWGLQDESAGGTTRRLQKLQVPVIKQATCQSWSAYKITSRMLCAGFEEGKKDACTGDSGGPLELKRGNGQWEQIGIVSWGEGCAGKHRPGIYSRVTEMIQFIQYQTESATWCKRDKA